MIVRRKRAVKTAARCERALARTFASPPRALRCASPHSPFKRQAHFFVFSLSFPLLGKFETFYGTVSSSVSQSLPVSLCFARDFAGIGEIGRLRTRRM